MSQFAKLLRDYFAERGTQTRVSEQGKIDIGNLAKIKDGDAGVTPDALVRIVRGFAPDRAKQADLVAAYCFDNLAAELRDLVEICKRVNGGRGLEVFHPQKDEFETALDNLLAARDNELIRNTVMNFAEIAKGYKEINKGTPNARSS